MRPRKRYRNKPKSIRDIKEGLYYNKDKKEKDLSDSDADIWGKYQSESKSKDTLASNKKKRSNKKGSSKEKYSGEKVPYLKITATVLLFGSVIFFLISVVIAVYVFFSGSFFVSADNIFIMVDGPDTVSSGEKVEFDVTVRNTNNVSLYNAKMIIRYPETARDPDRTTDSRIPTERVELGDLRADGISRRKVAFDLYGKKGEEHNLVIDLEYNIEGSSALFEKKKEVPIKIADSPMAINFEGPQKTYLNSADEYSVTLRSNSEEVLENVRVKVEYPINFRIIDSDQEMDKGTWRAGSLHPEEEKELTFKGMFTDYSEDERSRQLSVSAGPVYDTSVSVVESDLIVDVDSRPFEMDIVLKEGEVISFGDTVEGELVWKNRANMDIEEGGVDLAFRGVTVGDFEGENAEKSGGGLFWGDDVVGFSDKETVVIPFSFDVLFLKEVEDRGLELEAQFEGKTAQGESVSTHEQKSLPISTFFEMEVTSDVRKAQDSDGQTLRPMDAGETSDATLMFLVYTGAGDVEEAYITGSFPSSVTIDRVFSNYEPYDNINFDNDKGEFTWDLGSIEAGAGLWGQTRKIYLELVLEHQENEEGHDPVVMDFIEFVGRDEYTGDLLERTLTDVSIYGAGELDLPSYED